jgi:hypothetical protein
MSDLEEFMEAAQSRPSLHNLTQGKAIADRAASPSYEDRPGKPTQWSFHGDGYTPCPETTNTLPPGAYHLNNIPNIGLQLSRHALTTDNLMRLPDSTSDVVISEIERFWKLKEKFKQFGFVHKRGFLLWGPPGSGKTCTIAFVVQQTIVSGGLVFLGDHPGLLSTAMRALRHVEPDRKLVVVLEDIDTLIQRHGEAEILAILDGESSIDNVMFLATTNYPEKLDGRVVNRPSRFDRIVKIGTPSPEARKMYLESRGVKTDLDKWVELTKDFSIAHIKELIVSVCCFGEDLVAVATRLRSMSRPPKSDQRDMPLGFGRE